MHRLLQIVRMPDAFVRLALTDTEPMLQCRLICCKECVAMHVYFVRRHYYSKMLEPLHVTSVGHVIM